MRVANVDRKKLDEAQPRTVVGRGNQRRQPRARQTSVTEFNVPVQPG